MGNREKVILRKIPDYDPSKIERIIGEGLNELGLTQKAQGRITIKPNVVMAHHSVAPSAFTRPEFLEGMVNALKKGKKEPSKIVIAEKCGTGVPTSRMFRRAGYKNLKKIHNVKLLPIEEARKKECLLHKGKIHKKISTAREIVDNDFLIYAPKLKSNVLSQGLTASIKLNVGLLLDRERMWNHNFRLPDKIVDLLEVGFPDFIATDAIEISLGGNQFTQHGRGLGLIIMARNPVAHDAVCAHILHLDPFQIDHLRIAKERGYGPLNLEAIEITGDISLKEAQKRTQDWDLGFRRVDEVDCGIKVLCGQPYCPGGCHGIFLDWLYMIKDRKPALWKKLPPWTVVIGNYQGDVTADKLMLIGTCTQIQSEVHSKKQRKIKGCPPKHKTLILGFLLKARILNPLLRLDLIIDSYLFLFLSWCRKLISTRL